MPSCPVPENKQQPTANRWLLGARPRTLPAAVVPVLVGSACAAPGVNLWRALLAMTVALALQVAVNYANDYSDGVRGTDAGRVGPTRLVASGLATPQQVRLAALLAFGVAAVAGLALALASAPWLIAPGALATLAAWTYTGGPNPYGYRGLGELSVFVFFGLFATVGSAYVQGQALALAWLAAVPVGFWAVALLVANNLRDLAGDAAAGKRTLAVRLGEADTRRLYAGLIIGAYLFAPLLALTRPAALLALLSLPLAVAPLRAVLSGARGPALVPALGGTGRAQLVYGALLAAGLWWSA